MYSGVGAASLRLLMFTHAHTRLRTVVVRPTKTVHVYKRVCHALACLCYVWKRLQPECVCFHIVNACLCSSSEINNNFWYCVSLRFVHCFCWSKGNCVLATSLFLLTVNFRVSGTIFYKFVRRFDQDVQRCQSGFITPTHIHTHTHASGRLSFAQRRLCTFTRGFVTPWHVCATFGNGCNPDVYVLLYMHHIYMFSKQKYNI